MKNFILSLFILTNSAFAISLDLYNDDYLPSETKVEITLNKVELGPNLNDNNTFYFGDNDFEMFLTLNGSRQIEFLLEANKANTPKTVSLSQKFVVDIRDLNMAIGKRIDAENLTHTEKNTISRSRAGMICMLDDSLFSPEFLSTSFYGCFDLASGLQEMVDNKDIKKEFYVEKNTVYPASNDPAKAKMFKSWYTVRIIK